MKEYEYALSPTSQFFFCGVPFRLDIKPKCNLNCAYCFAMSRGGRRTNAEQIINTDRFSKFFSQCVRSGDQSNITQELISKRAPIHLGGMSDPFSDKESTEAFDKFFPLFCNQDDYPVVLSTKKPSEILKRDILIKKKNIIIQVSLPILDPTLQRTIEPLSDPVQSRLEAIGKLVLLGKNVSCRIQPIIPQLLPSIPKLIDALSRLQCTHVVFEFLKLPVEKNALNTSLLSEIFNVDMLAYYKANGATLIGREWLLPTEFRYNALLPIKQYSNNKGIHVSFGDYGLYHLGDCDCCCGIDLFGLNCTWNMGNFTMLIRRNKGEIHFSDLLEYWHPEHSMSRYINSKSRLGDDTMLSQLRNRWNHPGTANSPDSYLGVSCTWKKDDKDDYIYENYNVEEV